MNFSLIMLIVIICSFCSTVSGKAAQACNPTFGCRNNYCYRNCFNWGSNPKGGSEWCYTQNETIKDNRKTVNCESQADCDPCWECASACTWRKNLLPEEIDDN